MENDIIMLDATTSNIDRQRNDRIILNSHAPKSQRRPQPIENFMTSTPPHFQRPVQMVYPAIQRTDEGNPARMDTLSDSDAKDHYASSDMDEESSDVLYMSDELEDGKSGRRQRDFVPDRMKDSRYWVKRIKNNMAAKRSREKRRMADIVMEGKVSKLAQENEDLRSELANIKQMVQDSLAKEPEQKVARNDTNVVPPPQESQAHFVVGNSPQSIPLIIPAYPNQGTRIHSSPQEILLLSQSGLPHPGVPQCTLPQQSVPQAALPQSSLPKQVLLQNGAPHPSLLQPTLPQPSLLQPGLPQSSLPQQGVPPQSGLPQHVLLQHAAPHPGLLRPALPQPHLLQPHVPQSSLPQQGVPPQSGLQQHVLLQHGAPHPGLLQPTLQQPSLLQPGVPQSSLPQQGVPPQSGLQQHVLLQHVAPHPHPGLPQPGLPQLGIPPPNGVQPNLPQSSLPNPISLHTGVQRPGLPRQVQSIPPQRYDSLDARDTVNVSLGASNVILSDGCIPSFLSPVKNMNSLVRPERNDARCPDPFVSPVAGSEISPSTPLSNPVQNSRVESIDGTATTANITISKVRTLNTESSVSPLGRSQLLVESPTSKSEAKSTADDSDSLSSSMTSCDSPEAPSLAEINKLPHKLRARFLRSKCPPDEHPEVSPTDSEVGSPPKPIMGNDPILMNIKKEKEDDIPQAVDVMKIQSPSAPFAAAPCNFIPPKTEFPLNHMFSIEEELEQARRLMPTSNNAMNRSESQAYAEVAKAASALIGAHLHAKDFSAPSERQLTRQRTRDMNQVEKYRDKRSRNNIAAKKCRDAKRLLTDYRLARSNFFEVENMTLRNELDGLTKDVLRLRELVRKKLIAS